MSIAFRISRFNCFGTSALFAAVALVATAAAGGGPREDETPQQITVRPVSESCPDVSSVVFNLPAPRAAFAALR